VPSADFVGRSAYVGTGETAGRTALPAARAVSSLGYGHAHDAVERKQHANAIAPARMLSETKRPLPRRSLGSATRRTDAPMLFWCEGYLQFPPQAVEALECRAVRHDEQIGIGVFGLRGWRSSVLESRTHSAETSRTMPPTVERPQPETTRQIMLQAALRWAASAGLWSGGHKRIECRHDASPVNGWFVARGAGARPGREERREQPAEWQCRE